LDDENMVNKILQKIDLAGAAEDYQTLREKLLKQMEAKQSSRRFFIRIDLKTRYPKVFF